MAWPEWTSTRPARTPDDPSTSPTPQLAQAYFEELHYPLEEARRRLLVDGLAAGHAQQNAESGPAVVAQPPACLRSGAHGCKRPFIFSRWGGLGNHRYPIGFSGDYGDLGPSLAFQPYFTATAANVPTAGGATTSAGTWAASRTRELYTRWIQYGVLSPIMRHPQHQKPFQERRPVAATTNTISGHSPKMRCSSATP
jgi:hypothetical protein